MIKDRGIKEQVLKYAATRRWYPQMEVEVAPPARVARRVALVTDIDCLAIAPGPVLGGQTILFDCKTKVTESGANRALWLRGLMSHVNAEHAFCVLKKSSINADHRQVAQSLGVVLIPEDEFVIFARVTAGKDLETRAAVSSMEAWSRFADLRIRFPRLNPLLDYRAGEFWRTRSFHAACRKVVANVLEYKTEFDPAHIEHEALFGDLLSMFTLAMSSLVDSVFRLMLLPVSASDFDDVVRMKLYGGRDEYEQQNKLFKLLKQARHGVEVSEDLAPPEWPRFVKLLRQLLDDPNACYRSALIIKECSFALLTGTESYLRELTQHDKQATRFAVLLSDYFSKATKVPPEFGQRLEQRLLALA